jgi:hypothetical protein
MHPDIQAYNQSIPGEYGEICDILAKEIQKGLPEAESKIWHGHPVWFLNGNPITGYSLRKENVQLLFWSGQSFDEPGLDVEGTFKAAQVRYTSPDQINIADLARWLEKSQTVQWDYKNIVKRKGVLERITQ